MFWKLASMSFWGLGLAALVAGCGSDVRRQYTNSAGASGEASEGGAGDSGASGRRGGSGGSDRESGGARSEAGDVSAAGTLVVDDGGREGRGGESGNGTGGSAQGGQVAAPGAAGDVGVAATGGSGVGGVAGDGGSGASGAETGGSGGAETGGSGGAETGGSGGSNFIAPTLVSSSPEDGAIGVTPGSVVMTFSEAMDPASFTSDSVTTSGPIAVTGIAWNDDHTVATLTATYAFSNAPQEVTVGLATSIADAAGERLAFPAVVSFTLAALLTHEVDFDQSYSGFAATPVTTLTVGGSIMGGEIAPTREYTSLISFNLAYADASSLPVYAETRGLVSATLRAEVCNVQNLPQTLGDFLLERVSTQTVGGVVSASPSEDAGALFTEGSGISEGRVAEVNVTALVAASWPNASPPLSLIQFRLASPASNRDGVVDQFTLWRTGTSSDDDCTGASADPSRRLRLIVTYYQ